MIIQSTGYEFVKKLDMDELHTTYADHPRLRVFHHKGLQCSNPDCNLVGTQLIIGKDRGGNLHVDVYTDDLMLMNVDHHIPKSRGGSNHIY